jgi:tetratricopeptide (TPR) repeat protein
VTAPLRQPLAPEVVLGRDGEEEWQRFRRQLELHDGFWLGFLFTDAFTVSHAFRARTERSLRLRARHLLHLAPASPRELEATVPRLFDEDVRAAHLVWIEPAWGDRRTAETEKAWNRAWDRFFLRLNERRDRLRDTLGGALLIVAPRAVKPRVRDAAPDLWSIRAMVSDVVGAAPLVEFGGSRTAVGLETRQEDEPDLKVSMARSGPPIGDLHPEVVTLLRRAEGHLASGRPERAIPEAAEAVSLLQRENLPLDEALWTLARAEAASGDLAAAVEHSEVVVRDIDDHDASAFERLFLFAILLDKSELPARAEAAWRRALTMARDLVEREPGPAAEERMVPILTALGDSLIRLGRTNEAAELYEESLEIRRRLLADYGENADRLHGVSVSLERLGNVLSEQGDATGARRLCEESLEIRRRLLSEHGESLERLRGVSVSLERLGDVLLQQGDEAGAKSSYEESLEIRRHLLAEHGESPERLRDLSVSLERTGDLESQQGHAGARRCYEESLEIRRRLLVEHGESPERLHDLSVSLSKLGNVLFKQGDEAGAHRSYEELLEVDRRLLAEHGESPQRLRSVAVSLLMLGVLEGASDSASVRPRFTEAADLLRRIIDRYGNTKPRRRDLAFVEDRLAELADSPDPKLAASASE